MPRGKRTVYIGSCKECNTRIATVRLHRQKGTKTWKDFGPTKREGKKEDKGQYMKFCKVCRKKTAVKIKEEKHSST